MGVPGLPLGAPRGCFGGWEGAAGGPRGAGRGAGPPALFSAGRAPCVREGGFVVFYLFFNFFWDKTGEGWGVRGVGRGRGRPPWGWWMEGAGRGARIVAPLAA